MANTSPKAAPSASKKATPSANLVAHFRYGAVSAAIFADEVETKSGDSFTRYSVSVRRSYRNERGEWAYAHTFRGTDILAASVALQQCFAYIAGGPQIADGELK